VTQAPWASCLLYHEMFVNTMYMIMLHVACSILYAEILEKGLWCAFNPIQYLSILNVKHNYHYYYMLTFISL